MLYFSKNFRSFRDGVQAISEISFSAEQALTHCNHLWDSYDKTTAPDIHDLRERIEVGLIENDMGVETWDYATHYCTGRGVHFGWLQRPEETQITFYIGFEREGSISRNAITAGFEACDKLDIDGHIGNTVETRKRLSTYSDDVALKDKEDFQRSFDEFLTEHGLRRDQLLALPTYSEDHHMHVSVQCPSHHDTEINWDEVQYPCVVYYDKYEGSNACSRNWHHADLYVAPGVSFRFHSDCSTSDNYGSNEQYGHPLEELCS